MTLSEKTPLLSSLTRIVKRPDLLFFVCLYVFTLDFLSTDKTKGLVMLMSLGVKPLLLAYVMSSLLALARPAAETSGKAPFLSYFGSFFRIELTLRIVSLAVVLPAWFFLGNVVNFLHDEAVRTLFAQATIMVLFGLQFFWYAARTRAALGLIASLRQAGQIVRRNPGLFIGCVFVLIASHYSVNTAPGERADEPLRLFLNSLIFGPILLLTYDRVLRVALEECGPAEPAVTDSLPAGQPDAGAEEKKDARLATISFVLGLLSFIPFVHFPAAVFGFKVFRKQRTGRLRSLIGLLLGCFFSAMYLILLIGMLTGPKKIELLHTTTLERSSLSEEDRSVFKRATALMEEKNALDAVDVLEAYKDPKDPEAYAFALGLAHKQAGNNDEALARLNTCLRLPSHNGEALFHLGVLTASIPGKTGEAPLLFERFLEKFSGDPAALTEMKLIQNSIPYKDNIPLKVLQILLLLFSFSIHEFAHALAAYRCGDVTQRDKGRLSLNPLRHIEIFGSIILPLILLLKNSAFVFGWAKPVIVDKSLFRDPEKDDSFVSGVGPLSNLAVAMAATTLLLTFGLLLTRIFPDTRTLNLLQPFSDTAIVGAPFSLLLTTVAVLLKELVILSLILAAFNLLPIPPLDGSWILEHMLPAGLRPKFAALRRYGFLILIVLVATRIFDLVLTIPLQLFLGFSFGFIGTGIGLM